MLVQTRDAEGNLLTTAVSGGDYIADYKGTFKAADSWSFTLPEEVSTFKVGFVFSAAPSTAGAAIKISNIKLTKADA